MCDITCWCDITSGSQAEWQVRDWLRFKDSNFCLVSMNNIGIQLKLAIMAGCVPITIQGEGMVREP